METLEVQQAKVRRAFRIAVAVPIGADRDGLFALERYLAIVESLLGSRGVSAAHESEDVRELLSRAAFLDVRLGQLRKEETEGRLIDSGAEHALSNLTGRA